MKHEGITYVKIVRQVYQRGLKTVVSYLVEIKRDQHRRIYPHVSRRWRLWLEANTSALIFTDDRCYPKGMVDRLGIPGDSLLLRRKK
jgi:hypothetical protein